MIQCLYIFEFWGKLTVSITHLFIMILLVTNMLVTMEGSLHEAIEDHWADYIIACVLIGLLNLTLYQLLEITDMESMKNYVIIHLKNKES